MGVQDLQEFVETECQQACKPVDLLKISQGLLAKPTRRRGPNRLRLVVDAESCLDRLYGGYYSDWVCGGQWNRMTGFLSNLIHACMNGNMELVVFFNGALENQRLQEWHREQIRQKKNANLIFKHISNKGTPPPKIWWLPPPCLRSGLRLALRQLGVSVACSMDDHHQEVIAYCRENSFNGILAQDSDYAVFDPPRYFSSHHLKLTFRGGLETLEYIIDEVAKKIDLHPKRFCVLAALLGTHLLSEDELRGFFNRVCQLAPKDDVKKVPVKDVIQAVILYVRALPSVDDLDTIGQDVFKSSGKNTEDKISRFKESVQYYRNGTQEGFLKYRPKLKAVSLPVKQPGSYPAKKDGKAAKAAKGKPAEKAKKKDVAATDEDAKTAEVKTEKKETSDGDRAGSPTAEDSLPVCSPEGKASGGGDASDDKDGSFKADTVYIEGESGYAGSEPDKVGAPEIVIDPPSNAGTELEEVQAPDVAEHGDEEKAEEPAAEVSVKLEEAEEAAESAKESSPEVESIPEAPVKEEASPDPVKDSSPEPVKEPSPEKVFGGAIVKEEPGESKSLTESGESKVLTETAESKSLTESGESKLLTETAETKSLTESEDSKSLTESGESKLLTETAEARPLEVHKLSSSSSSSSTGSSPSRLSPEAAWNLKQTIKTPPQVVAATTSKPERKVPKVLPEIMRIASDRHQKGLMFPWIYQILTQGEVKIESTLEDELSRELPSVVDLYRPVRQKVYSVLFDLNKQRAGWKTAAKEAKGEGQAPPEKPKVTIKEWVSPYGSSPNSQPKCHAVQAEPLEWLCPGMHRLWLGQAVEDKNRRLRAFLSCLHSDTPLMLNTNYVPQHLLLMCCVLRYILRYEPQQVLRRHELDAFLATAVSPLLHDVDTMQDMKLPMITNRGVQLAALFMRGVEQAQLVNDAVGAPIPWSVCCPWLFFDGKLFHFKLLKANNNTPLIDICDGHVDQVMGVERMRQAVLEGIRQDLAFARPTLPLVCPQYGAFYPPGMTMTPAGALPPPGQPGIGRGLGRGRGLLGHSPVDARGGQLQIAGVVVGSWGANTQTRDRPYAPPPQVTSVGPRRSYGRGVVSSRAARGRAGRPYGGRYGQKAQIPAQRSFTSASGVRGANQNKSKGKGKGSAQAKLDLTKVTLEQRTKIPGGGRGRGCTVENPLDGSSVVSVSQLLMTAEQGAHDEDVKGVIAPSVAKRPSADIDAERPANNDGGPSVAEVGDVSAAKLNEVSHVEAPTSPAHAHTGVQLNGSLGLEIDSID